MKPILRWLYILTVLAAGAALSIFLVNRAIHHDITLDEVVAPDPFPDYTLILNSYYKNFENRKTHFHQTEDRHFLPMEQQEVCLTCHSLWPHARDPKTRAFNNQHSRYMTCMGCHVEETSGRKVDFAWWDYAVDNSITREGPYGLTRDGNGVLSSEDNFITRIVPAFLDGSQISRIFTPYGTITYAEYRDAVRNGAEVDANAVRMEAEALMGSPARNCKDCHAEDALFPWEALGFRGTRLEEMIHSAVVGMIENYDSFYFPPLFE